MKTTSKILIICIIFIFITNACSQNPTTTTTQNPTATSELPTAASESDQSNSLQLENELPISQLYTKPSQELEDNRIGANSETIHVDSHVWNAGLKWMRMIIDSRGEWQYVDWDGNEYAIDPDEEKVIDDLLSKGIRIMLVLDVWRTEHRTVNYRTEEDISTFTNWVRFVVRHFKGRIEYYEILNEPNLDFNAPSGMPVDTYINLVKQTVPVIREEDPDAKIVLGAVPDTRFIDARTWIWDLLDSGIMPFVDGLSWHGMYGAAPSDDQRGVRQPRHPQTSKYWENYPDYVEEIKNVAASNEFKGEFLTEEMLWRTPDMPHQTEPDKFTDIAAAKYYARSIVIHLGLNVSPGLALPPDDDMPRSYTTIQALSTIMAGTQSEYLPVTIESEASNIKYYGFANSNGGKLLAIWVDDAAVDDFSGIPISLTLPDSPAQVVTGFDPLNGIEQQIVTEDQGENLVIKGLLIKDYPIFIKFNMKKAVQ